MTSSRHWNIKNIVVIPLQQCCFLIKHNFTQTFAQWSKIKSRKKIDMGIFMFCSNTQLLIYARRSYGFYLEKKWQRPPSKIAIAVSPNTSEGAEIRQPQPDMSLYSLFLSLKRFFKPRNKNLLIVTVFYRLILRPIIFCYCYNIDWKLSMKFENRWKNENWSAHVQMKWNFIVSWYKSLKKISMHPQFYR